MNKSVHSYFADDGGQRGTNTEPTIEVLVDHPLCDAAVEETKHTEGGSSSPVRSPLCSGFLIVRSFFPEEILSREVSGHGNAGSLCSVAGPLSEHNRIEA